METDVAMAVCAGGIAEVPISWEKVHGGDVVQWIGYEIDVRTFSRGVSAKKVEWVSNWIERRLKDGGTVGRDLKSALGRLVFVAGALQHVRPFLGPIFGWSAVLTVRENTRRSGPTVQVHREANTR